MAKTQTYLRTSKCAVSNRQKGMNYARMGNSRAANAFSCHIADLPRYPRNTDIWHVFVSDIALRRFTLRVCAGEFGIW